MSITYTPNYNLAKPDRGTLEWDTYINNNFSTIDQIIKSISDQFNTELVRLGDNNQAVNLFRALNQQIDTRNLELDYDTNGNLTTVYEKDGETTVKTTTLGYDSNGNLSTVTEQVGGRTITTTLSYDTNGNLTGITRQVS